MFLYNDRGDSLFQLYKQSHMPFFELLVQTNSKQSVSVYRLFSHMMARLTQQGGKEESEHRNEENFGNKRKAEVNSLLRKVDDLVVRLVNPNAQPAHTLYHRDISSYKDEVQKNKSVSRAIAFQELMIWAVFMNRRELAEYFWQQGGAYMFFLLIQHYCV